jgi:predicted RND superfamily exporter protein
MGLRDRVEQGFERSGLAVCRHRWLAAAAMLLLTALLGAGMARIGFETSTEIYLDPTDPTRARYDAFRSQFANDDTLLLLLHSDRIFSFGFLEKLRALHEDLESELPLVDEVKSLINARVTRGSQDELIVEDLFEQWPEDERELQARAELASQIPVYRNTLLSEDGRYTTVTVRVTPGGGRDEVDALGEFDADERLARADGEVAVPLPPILHGEELQSVMLHLREIAARHATSDFPIYITGNPEMTFAIMEALSRDMPFTTGLANLVIALLLAVFFRRISGVVLPLTIVMLPLVATLGVMGFVGLPITPSTQQLPAFLVAVCVGDSVHLLTIFYQRFDGGSEKQEAIVAALGHSGFPVLMTSLTTAAALGSFYFADLAPLSGLGVAAPVGVMLALVYALVLLPALLAILPIRRRRAAAARPRAAAPPSALEKLAGFTSRRPWLVVSVWSLLALVSVAYAARLELGHKPLEWFPEDHPTRVAAELTNREMKGLMPLEIIVDSGHENGLHDPAVMDRLDRIQSFAKQVEAGGLKAGQAISVADILKETHRALNEGDPDAYRIPRERAVIAQELLLFENSGSDDLEDVVDAQFRKARVTMLVPYADGLLYLGLLDAVEPGIKRIAGDLVEAETTGLVTLWVRTFHAMLSSTAKSYAIALVMITPLMLLLIGDVRIGLLSLVPNLVPILMAMGLMSALGIHFDMTTMMIGSIAIGIVVDDTIHFMHTWRRYYGLGHSAPEAVRATMTSTGRALVVTSIALCSGFFVQLAGTMTSSKNVGFITGFAILAALCADLVLSPALVVLAARQAEKRSGLGSRPRSTADR